MPDMHFSEDKVIGKCYKCEVDVSERGSVEMTQGGKDTKRMCLDCYRSFLKHHVIMGIVWAVIGAVVGVAGGFFAVLAFAYAGWGLYYGATASFWNARFWRKASTAGAVPRGSWGEIGLNFLKVGVYLVGSQCYGIFGGAIYRFIHDARELKALSSLDSPQSPTEDEARTEVNTVPGGTYKSHDDEQVRDSGPFGSAPKDKVVCPSCGYTNSEGSRFCLKCGAALVVAEDPDASKDQRVATLTPYRKGDKWGYCDRDRKVIIPAIYEWGGSFAEGLAPVQLNGKHGFIDTTGNMTVPAVYDDAEPFSEGLAGVTFADNYGFVDPQGNMAIPATYGGGGAFSDGLAPVRLGDKLVFIDTKGNIAIPTDYDKAGSFSQGLAWVSLDGYYGFIDTQGNMAIPADYDWAFSFSDGLAAVRLDGKWGFIDTHGNMAIPADYVGVYPFSDGLASVIVGGKWGFIDTRGNMAIPAVYDDMDSFGEGLARVTRNGRHGFINTKGNMAIGFATYDDAPESFSQGFARVTLNGKHGLIDTNGTQYWQD